MCFRRCLKGENIRFGLEFSWHTKVQVNSHCICVNFCTKIDQLTPQFNVLKCNGDHLLVPKLVEIYHSRHFRTLKFLLGLYKCISICIYRGINKPFNPQISFWQYCICLLGNGGRYKWWSSTEIRISPNNKHMDSSIVCHVLLPFHLGRYTNIGSNAPMIVWAWKEILLSI